MSKPTVAAPDPPDCEACGGPPIHGRTLCRACLYWRHIGKLEDAVVAVRESSAMHASPLTDKQRQAWSALMALVAGGVHHG